MKSLPGNTLFREENIFNRVVTILQQKIIIKPWRFAGRKISTVLTNIFYQVLKKQENIRAGKFSIIRLITNSSDHSK